MSNFVVITLLLLFLQFLYIEYVISGRMEKEISLKSHVLRDFKCNLMYFVISNVYYKKFGFLRPKFLRSANTSH